MFFSGIIIPLFASSVAMASPLEARNVQTRNIYCNDRHLVTPNSGAMNNLLDQVKQTCEIRGEEIPVGDKKVFAINHPSLQIYFCNHNFDFPSNQCRVGRYQEADNMITEHCGADGTGYVRYFTENGAPDLTVGRDQAGFTAC